MAARLVGCALDPWYFSETLFSIHGFAGENVIVVLHVLDADSSYHGWNDAANSLYFTSRVYDNIHVTQRVDAGRFYWDDS